MSDVLRVCALYPSRMNIYADRGNIIVLRRRCEARGIGFEMTAAESDYVIDPAAFDLFYIGGGQDRDQEQIASNMLATKGAALAEAADSGKVILGVCGGYQLLGESYQLDSRQIQGLGIVGAKTVREPGNRLIGNVIVTVETESGPQMLAGFENHGGRTYLDDGAKPLGRVVAGFGNNGRDGFEGVRKNNVFGTYLHGPLLPKNVWFADYLTALALGRDDALLPLGPLDDGLEQRAHESALRAARRNNSGGPFGRLTSAVRGR